MHIMSVHEVVNDPDPLVVKEIEDLLTSAKAGKVRMIAYTAHGEETFFDRIVCAPTGYYALHAHLSILKNQLADMMVKSLYEEDND